MNNVKKYSKVFIIVGIVLLICAGGFGMKSYSAHESAQRAIANQSLDLKLYGWEGANSSYYDTYEKYTKTENTYKSIAIISSVGSIGCISIGVLGKRKSNL